MTHVPTLVEDTGEYRRKIAAKIHTTGNARVTSKAHVNTIAVNVVIRSTMGRCHMSLMGVEGWAVRIISRGLSQ